MTIYLYIKTHNKTGLKYLGKTKNSNPHKYTGSGTTWLEHIKHYGRDISTEILKECSCQHELSYWGRYYSLLFKITTAMDDYGNMIWANRIPETGGGPGASSHTMSNINRKKVNNGKHQFQKRLDGSSISSDMVKSGLHNFIGGNIQREMNKRTLAAGTHPSQKQWKCTHCSKEGKGASNYTQHIRICK